MRYRRTVWEISRGGALVIVYSAIKSNDACHCVQKNFDCRVVKRTGPPLIGGRSSSRPSVPVERAMKLCLNRRPPLGQLLDVSSPSVNLRCFQSALKQLPPSGSDLARPCRSRGKLAQRSSSDDCGGARKKRVAFADSKGLSLTAVCFFTDKDEWPSPEPVLRLEALRVPAEGTCAGKSPRLGFPLPSADFQAFRAKLQEGLVLLESCSVTERALSGTVRVKNVSYEKEVRLRITFDSWRSHHNVPCTYMHQSYGAPDTDVFAFDVPLPRDLDPQERIEFCISYQPGGYSTPLWDNNMGQNYSILTGPEATARPQQPPLAVASHNRDLRVPQHGPDRVLHRSASCYEILSNQNLGPLENSAPFW